MLGDFNAACVGIVVQGRASPEFGVACLYQVSVGFKKCLPLFFWEILEQWSKGRLSCNSATGDTLR